MSGNQRMQSVVDLPPPGHLRLSAAEHVAKREAEKLIRKAEAANEQRFQLGNVINRVNKRFSNGRKLTNNELEELAHFLCGSIRGTDPLAFLERREARGSFETRFITRYKPSDQQTVNLVSRQISMTRKRLIVSTVDIAVEYSRHLAERAIERDVAAWDQKLSDLEAVVRDSLGLSTIWRYAVGQGQLDHGRIAIPIGNGLILGQITRTDPNHRPHQKIISGRDACTILDKPQSPWIMTEDNRQLLSLRYATTVGQPMLRVDQSALRDALSAFQDRYQQELARIADHFLWPDLIELQDGVGTGSEPVTRQLAEELVDLLRVPLHQSALNGPSCKYEPDLRRA